MELSFGEQIKIILKRKGMTIQDLAVLYESQTGQKMTRQNLSQRLNRDNFPEQDMHALAAMLGYQVSVQLTPMSIPSPSVTSVQSIPINTPPVTPAVSAPGAPSLQQVTTADGSTLQVPNLLRKSHIQGEINPLTGEEYLSNTVRQHPTLANYLQVYDQSTHEWSDVGEEYFWEFQANKKEIMGSDYQEPIVI